ncbi:uncharacterized protein MONOS_17784 [Monocercomonoides exilis]|uniref:uncharacterized protein n=1 Tax=Monocercomonoides exilis TaxID=2049356 RepID=UPI003559C3BB|nr:hypothetical protein MONOS_17784 [Monocercomonoides exilis]
MKATTEERLNKKLTGNFIELASTLSKLNESEQKQKIIEMNGMIDEMNKNDLDSVMSVELFRDINELINDEKMTVENAALLFGHIGYRKSLFSLTKKNFDRTSLIDSFGGMILKEKRRRRRKNEKLLADLCECYLSLLDERFVCSNDIFPISIPCLLKVALNKEKSEEAQKKVEMALLALSNINKLCIIEQKLYLKEIKEIIKYHQEHHNLTRLAYQSVWEFLINRFYHEESLEEVIVNELHFGREAARELEELSNYAEHQGMMNQDYLMRQ